MKIELFFDYVCPYCYEGHKNILKMKEKYPELEIIWKPCEAHPRPEPAPVHSDAAIRGMCYVRDHQGDLWNYHRLVYEAHFEKRLDVSDPEVLGTLGAECGVDTDEFKNMLMGGDYEQEVLENNRYAWEEKNLKAVPSYLSGTRFVGSKDGLLVSLRELDRFLSACRE